MRLEQLDQRVLGAVQFIDAPTGNRVFAPLRLGAIGVRFIQNRSGQYVILTQPDLVAHTEAFVAPPANPAIGTVPVEISVTDPSGMYLDRISTIRLPRDPSPANAAQAGSLFRAVDVNLFPTPAFRIEPNWAVVRATVVRQGSAQGLASALLRVIRANDDVVLARGVSDRRGEALVAVPGVPVTTFSDDENAVIVTAVAVSIEAIFDPDLEGAPDPDVLETRADNNDANLRRVTVDNLSLSSGRSLSITLPVALP